MIIKYLAQRKRLKDEKAEEIEENGKFEEHNAKDVFKKNLDSQMDENRTSEENTINDPIAKVQDLTTITGEQHSENLTASEISINTTTTNDKNNNSSILHPPKKKQKHVVLSHLFDEDEN